MYNKIKDLLKKENNRNGMKFSSITFSNFLKGLSNKRIKSIGFRLQDQG